MGGGNNILFIYIKIIILKSQKLKEIINYVYVYVKSRERLCEGVGESSLCVFSRITCWVLN